MPGVTADLGQATATPDDIDARRIDVSFFLGDNADGTDRRSPYQSFQLEWQTDAKPGRAVGQTE